MHPDAVTRGLRIEAVTGGWRGCFQALGSPCEVLLDGATAAQAQAWVPLAFEEALRIEHRYSRYRADSLLAQWQAAAGTPVALDAESAALIDFADTCHTLSEGRFDITSGVLRHAWRFDGRAPEPATPAAMAARIEGLMARVGWRRVRWQRPWLTLPPGVELDLGGIGKEYAVDRSLALLRAAGAQAVLVNYGGDLAVSGPRADGSPWQVGIEAPDAHAAAAGVLALHEGALATSGDSHRHVLHAGRRCGHVLDARTGWPVQGAPRSVTVAAARCTEAGAMATLALLQGPQARAWLQSQQVTHWVVDERAEPHTPAPQDPAPTPALPHPLTPRLQPC